ncbi:MAG: hypothetical protein ACR2QR_12040 [Woeseiaceae bacterium]
MVRKALLALTILSLAGVAGAQGETEEEGPWSGSWSLGYLSTAGNTDNTTYNTKFAVSHKKND